eukprot:TRINITY_DN10677_c0_g1_i1.p1 TRINITY_DN10677_c0_g1~~TRINITY_DN10677_c0_g1_i1.p1  ORF type:complete len:370 (-),score=70.08 TRINITY_DN10677_c0_g1_i1:33-1142(-)
MKPQKVVVRLYILRGNRLVPADPDGFADSYIEINNGKRGGFPNIIDKDNVVHKTLNPGFYKCYSFNMTLPDEEDQIHISVWDEDKYSKDDLIGTTIIDLGNRWFDPSWQSLKRKPIESRTLWNPSSSHSQGSLEMFVDILTESDAAANPPEDISPPKPQNWQLRIVIWETENVAFKDNKSNDIFVSARPQGLEPQTTDVHYYSNDGKGLFNWRMVWDLTLPMKIPRLVIQVWDKDFLNPNDAICEAVLNLNSFFKKAFADKDKRHKIDRQPIVLSHPNASGPQGTVFLDVELVPEEDAKRNPVGLGRGEPNRDPFLPEPPRPKWSFNPFRIDKWISLWWGNYRWKLILAGVICLVLLLVIIIASLSAYF